MRYRYTLLSALTILVIASACSPAVVDPEAQSPTEGAIASETGGGFSITDALGRELDFEQPPQRVAIAGRASSLLANALYLFPEASQRIVGIEDRSTQSASPILPVIDPDPGDKIFFEKNAGPEQIAPAHPDVVILKSYMAESLGEPLEKLGITIVYLDLETPEQFFRDIEILGKLFGNSERAREVQSYYQERLDRVQMVTADIPATQKPSVLIIQYSDQGGDVAFKIPPASWLQTTMVELVGGAPVWTEASETGGWAIVNFEQIAAWNPDQIYVVYYPGDAKPITEHLKSDPKWQAIKAVQQNQLFAFPGDFLSWDQPDTRWILGLSWLFTKVQPELADDIDIMQEVNQFYEQLYRLDQEIIQDEVNPVLNGDLP
ncbi:MAG: ABC transporter substrate-binding protein [Anaerolineales bacterium]|nr:ABC transporter substrate-binding protein [Anaerolineales bacterium]